MTFQKNQFSSRDGSSAAKIFPEIARVSLLTGYKIVFNTCKDDIDLERLELFIWQIF